MIGGLLEVLLIVIVLYGRRLTVWLLDQLLNGGVLRWLGSLLVAVIWLKVLLWLLLRHLLCEGWRKAPTTLVLR
jgi:hypothetical protein